MTLHGNGTLDDGQHQFLYSRAITTYFNLQGGLRSDMDSRPTSNWGAFGIEGLAPYFFDLELTGFVSGQGHPIGLQTGGRLRSDFISAF